jgi:dTDP-4-dehydrorhamnose 3,5-epimerase
MHFEKTLLPDVFVLNNRAMEDIRGIFTKTFNAELFAKNGLKTGFLESFYSESKRNVIRGMHFQVPPFENDKIVYVVNGSILDVVLDIRKGSPSFGKHINLVLSRENRKCMYVPEGCAHGFISLSDTATVVYMQTSVYSGTHDAGILWNSFGMEWGMSQPIMSERDKSFPGLGQFDSPFVYKGQ